MNQLKTFAIKKAGNNYIQYVFFCNNYQYKVFKNVNTFQFTVVKKIFYNNIQFQEITVLSVILLHFKKFFFYKTNDLFLFKKIFVFKNFKIFFQKLFLIYFKKEKEMFFCGFLGTVALIPLKKVDKNNKIKGNIQSLSLYFQKPLYSKIFLKKRLKILSKLLHSKVAINKQFQLYSLFLLNPFGIYANALNLSAYLKMKLKLISVQNNLVQKNSFVFLSKKLKKNYFFFRKKFFNLNFY